MESSRYLFPHDAEERIQSLYYDTDLCAPALKRAALQNIKTKFYKYVRYLEKTEHACVRPRLAELEQARLEIYERWQRAKRISIIHDPTDENVRKRQLLVPLFREADNVYTEAILEQRVYVSAIAMIYDKISDIVRIQRERGRVARGTNLPADRYVDKIDRPCPPQVGST